MSVANLRQFIETILTRVAISASSTMSGVHTFLMRSGRKLGMRILECKVRFKLRLTENLLIVVEQRKEVKKVKVKVK